MHIIVSNFFLASAFPNVCEENLADDYFYFLSYRKECTFLYDKKTELRQCLKLCFLLYLVRSALMPNINSTIFSTALVKLVIKISRCNG